MAKYIKTKATLILFILAAFTAGCPGYGKARFSELMQKGDLLFSRREYAQAATAWEKALNYNTQNITVHKKLGQVYLKLVDHVKADEMFSFIIKKEPDDWGAHLEMAKLALTRGDFSEADKIGSMVIRRSPDKPSANMFQGDLHVLKNNYKQAEKYYMIAVSDSRTFFPALIRLATCSVAQGKISESENYLKIAEVSENKSAFNQELLYKYWKLRNNPVRAGKALEKAISLEPEDLALQMRLARHDMDYGAVDKAEKRLMRILDKRPETHPARKLLVDST